MRSKQYFTSIKNNPHEISTDPFILKKDIKKEFHFSCETPQWTLTDSNRRPSACKADALNQLS